MSRDPDMRILFPLIERFQDHPTYLDRPIILNEGTPYEEPFSITLALRWAERLMEEERWDD